MYVTANSVHFYMDAIGFGLAIIALVPVYRGTEKKSLILPAAIILVCVIGVSVVLRVEHVRRIATIESHIIRSLDGGQKTFDELGHELPYSEVADLGEALDELMNAPGEPVRYGDVRVQNCDGSILVDVRRYYLVTSAKGVK
jgi:hypothetical protein